MTFDDYFFGPLRGDPNTREGQILNDKQLMQRQMYNILALAPAYDTARKAWDTSRLVALEEAATIAEEHECPNFDPDCSVQNVEVAEAIRKRIK